MASAPAIQDEFASCKYAKLVKESWRRGQNISHSPAFSLYQPFCSQVNRDHPPRQQPTNLLGFWLNITFLSAKIDNFLFKNNSNILFHDNFVKELHI